MARGYTKAVNQARHLIYLEDQYLWSPEVAATLAAALQRNPKLHLVAVLPLFPDQDGRIFMPPNLLARDSAIATLRAAAPGRVAFYGLENPEGVPVYVHARSASSMTSGPRSGPTTSTADPGLTIPNSLPRSTTLAIRGSCDSTWPASTLTEGPLDDLRDPTTMFTTFVDCAAQLQGWYGAGRQGARPPGRLRPVQDAPATTLTRAWATALYRLIYDPDGRPIKLRMRRSF